MQRGVAIHALGGKLWPKEAICKTTISSESQLILAARGRILAHLDRLLPNRRIYGFTPFSLLYEVPGGNQVDGLPPAASTGAGC